MTFALMIGVRTLPGEQAPIPPEKVAPLCRELRELATKRLGVEMVTDILEPKGETNG